MIDINNIKTLFKVDKNDNDLILESKDKTKYYIKNIDNNYLFNFDNDICYSYELLAENLSRKIYNSKENNIVIINKEFEILLIFPFMYEQTRQTKIIKKENFDMFLSLFLNQIIYMNEANILYIGDNDIYEKEIFNCIEEISKKNNNIGYMNFNFDSEEIKKELKNLNIIDNTVEKNNIYKKFFIISFVVILFNIILLNVVNIKMNDFFENKKNLSLKEIEDNSYKRIELMNEKLLLEQKLKDIDCGTN